MYMEMIESIQQTGVAYCNRFINNIHEKIIDSDCLKEMQFSGNAM